MTATTTTTITTTTRTDAARSAGPALACHTVVDRAVRAGWCELAGSNGEGTLFHHPDWSDAVADVFSHRPAHIFAMRGERLFGVLPMFEVRSWLTGRLLVSVPYAVYGGILADDDCAATALAQTAEDLALARGARHIDVRSRNAEIHGWDCETRYAGFRKRLPLTVAELDGFLPRKARAAARQARQREGLVVRHHDHGLHSAWRLYARSMRRLASLAYPFAFFESLASRGAWRTWVTFVERDGRPAAGVVSFAFGDSVQPYFLGVDERVRCTGATNLLYLGVMERAVRAGLHWFDFGRTRKNNTGPLEFKRNQGFEPYTLGYQAFTPAGGVRPNLSPANPRFAAARRLWPHLPLGVTTRLGGWLAGAIPG